MCIYFLSLSLWPNCHLTYWRIEIGNIYIYVILPFCRRHGTHADDRHRYQIKAEIGQIGENQGQHSDTVGRYVGLGLELIYSGHNLALTDTAAD